MGVGELQREGYHVSGVVRVPPRRAPEAQSSRGSFIHVLQRSVGDVSVKESSAPKPAQNSAYVSKYSDFTKQFMGALRDAERQRLLPAPVSLDRAVHKEKEYNRLTSALQSTLNRVSSAPVLLRSEFMRPVVEEADQEVREDVQRLFDTQSVFASRFLEDAPQPRFWERRIDFRPFALFEKYFRPDERRQSMIQQLKEVHYGKDNRNNLD